LEHPPHCVLGACLLLSLYSAVLSAFASFTSTLTFSLSKMAQIVYENTTHQVWWTE
jgi:hypothetical protein